jgi:hypothetical protein
MAVVVTGRPAWIDDVFKRLEGVFPKDFVGQVEVNVFKGGLSNINVRQSHKPEEVTTK